MRFSTGAPHALGSFFRGGYPRVLSTFAALGAQNQGQELGAHGVGGVEPTKGFRRDNHGHRGLSLGAFNEATPSAESGNEEMLRLFSECDSRLPDPDGLGERPFDDVAHAIRIVASPGSNRLVGPFPRTTLVLKIEGHEQTMLMQW